MGVGYRCEHGSFVFFLESVFDKTVSVVQIDKVERILQHDIALGGPKTWTAFRQRSDNHNTKRNREHLLVSIRLVLVLVLYVSLAFWDGQVGRNFWI